jgi:hypothetical protein
LAAAQRLPSRGVTVTDPIRASFRRSILLGVLLAGCAATETPSPSLGGPTPTGLAEPTATASASEPEPTSTPLPVELTWSSESFPANVAALAADGETLVAVGRDRDGLAAWTSSGGADWERHAVPDPTFIDEMVDTFGPQIYQGTRMGPLTRLGDTLFSFGTFSGPIDFYRPVAWRSSDGTSWEFVESDNDFYQYGAITDVETFHAGLVAARATGLIGPNNSLWTWEADASWKETSIRSARGAALVRLDAAAVGNQVVVVGQVAGREELDDLGANRPLAWMSSDAEQWNEIELPTGIASACGVDASPSGGFSVMGTRENGDISVWTWDGSTWVRFDLATGLCGDYPMTLAGDWLVASISTGDEGSMVWLSRDGLEWVRQDIPEIQSVAVAELNGELYILGTPRDDRPYQSVLLHGVP